MSGLSERIVLGLVIRDGLNFDLIGTYLCRCEVVPEVTFETITSLSQYAKSPFR